MPKMTERDRLAKLEASQRRVGDEVEKARRAVRDRYAGMVNEVPVEQFTEREFRELLRETLRVGGAAALGALKGLPAER